jgi:phosphoribosyl-ATP pyrophosphohydrolase
VSRSADLAEIADLAVDAQWRARALKERGALAYLADDPDCPEVKRLAALGEEYGEVCRAIHDDDRAQLAVELAQLAGVALAWLKYEYGER